MADRARELPAVLERWLAPPVRVRACRRSPYASSFPLDAVEVETGNGELLALVWKDVSPAALLPPARRARGRAGAAPASREPRAYDLLDGARIGTPYRYGALCEPDRAWLFLEAVHGTRLDHVGDRAGWEAVARWLATAHARLAERAGDDVDWLHAWRPPEVAALVAAADDRARRRRIAALADPVAAAAARVSALPLTVVHGELYPANVLLAGQERVCVLDWETIALGPALLDLATLTAGRWEEYGEPLAAAYQAALADPPPSAVLVRDLDACRLLVAAGRLADPPDWSPPREQARDWLADAEMVARRVVS